MPLDSRWIDALHTRMLVRYGSKWMNLYAGLDESLVKQDWAEELNGIIPESIKHALLHLPDDPPNVMQFKALCIRGPEKVAPALTWSRDVAPEVLERVKQIRQGIAAEHPKAWAYRLREREASKDRLTIAQKTMWRAALAEEMKREATA